MSSDPVKEAVSPLSTTIRRLSQIARKPVPNRHASLDVTHALNHHRTSVANTDGVSPISRLSSGPRSPPRRMTSSYFSPDSIRFSRHASNAWPASPVPFLDLDASESEMQMRHVPEYSNRESSVRPESRIERRRNTSVSVYSQQGLEANAYPLFGMSADEAAYLASSAVTSEAGSLHRGLERSIVEARAQHEMLRAELEQITREPTLEQMTDQPNSVPPGSGLKRTADMLSSGSSSNWLPVSLRWWFMLFLFCLSFGLGLAALLLTLRSRDYQGLGFDMGTSTFLFAWKFIPTLLAVVYIILIMTMVSDIKRTEPYARLSRPAGAPASTLFLKPGLLWTDPVTALSKASNGGVPNWALFWAAIINILSILLVVPFSAAFIYPAEVVVWNSSNFSGPAVSTHGPLNLSTDDSVLFRTISGELLNTSTSAWVSNDYSIIPFWPLGEKTVPLGGVLPSPQQQWTTNTTVYQVELKCDSMNLQSFSNITIPATQNSSRIDFLSFVIGSDDGCSLGLTGFAPDSGSSTIFSTGGGWWSSAPNFSPPPFWPKGNGTVSDLSASNQILLNATSQCGTRDVFFLTEPYVWNETFKAIGKVCSSSYYSASLPVTVSNAESQPSFDTEVYESEKQSISTNVLDIPTFERSFLNENWASKFQSPSPGSNPDLPRWPKLGGPLNLLGAENSFNLSSMFVNPNLTTQARQIKQRFLGESMLSTFHNTGAQNSEPMPGGLASIEQRIVVSFAVGIMLGVTMLLSSFMIFIVAFYTRPDRRPLNLLQEPGSLKAMASLISMRPDIRSLFQGTDRASEIAMHHKLAGYVLYLRNGELYAYGMDDVSQFSAGIYSDAEPLETDTWYPRILRDISLGVFFASTIIITLILAVLFGVFHEKPISHMLLGAESEWNYTDRTVVELAPYSVIPTLICLGLMICWASTATSIRTLQPYVSMARKATLSPRDPAAYVNINLLWTIGSAGWKREYLLSAVALCAILSQILTVAISGLWERHPALQTQNVTALRSAELRTVPAIFTVVAPPASTAETTSSEGILANIFDNLLTSWMYSSVNEGVYNSNPAPWTSKDWAFAPFDLTAIHTPSDAKAGNATSSYHRSRNYVTLQTTSLRGRLECIPIDMTNTSAWLTTLNLTDTTTGSSNNGSSNLTVAYEIKPTFFSPDGSATGSGLRFNISTARCQMPNAPPDPSSTQETAIGYWTRAEDDPYESIVVQWITGYPIPYPLLNSRQENGQTHWIWKDVPNITALKCVPVFESGEASINVVPATGAIQNFTITNDPSPDIHAWSSRYQSLNVSTGVPYSSSPGIGAGFQTKSGVFLQNVSVSYGYLFHDTILGAANTSRVVAMPQNSPSITESPVAIADTISDRSFSFSLPDLSADFMSYTSLALSGNNISALLDPATLGNVSSTVFSLFFKNFAQTNVPANDALLMDGAWGFQPLGATVPSDLGPILGSDPAIKLQNSISPSNTNASTQGVLSTEVENMVINHTVAILCLCILSIFIVTIIGISVYRGKYLQDLPRSLDTVGSVLGLVYGSERLLRQAVESVNKTEQYAGRKMLKMGWFDVGEKRRWGLEVVQPGDRFSQEFLGADRGFKEIRLSN